MTFFPNVALKIGIWGDKPFFRPLNQAIRIIYIHLIIRALSIFFRLSYPSVRVFSRRSSTSSDSNFNFVFSDLDIGICVEDSISDYQVAGIKKFVYALKRYFIFIGELEIYTETESKILNKLLPSSNYLYDRLRDHRKANWIKSKLKQSDRNIYHRYKDHRALVIFKENNSISSSHGSVKLLLNELGEVSLANHKPNNFNVPIKIYCDYLSQTFRIESPESKWLRILAATPTLTRGQNEVDQLVLEIRKKNEDLKTIFETLNTIEFVIANAFIRGSKTPEPWHEEWLLKLRQGPILFNINT